MHERRLIFRHNCIVDVFIPERRNDPLSKTRRALNALKQSQRQQHTTGIMSTTAARKLKSIAECYLQAIAFKRDAQTRAGVRISTVPTFITLTYPSVQTHDDEHCKRQHLKPFLSYLTRSKHCAAYLWRAELQQNGNIHFHVMSDRFVEWQWIRTTWNNCIAQDGYIAAFAAKHGHTNPNSTDVEKIANIDAAAMYITKYISKIDPSVQRQIKGRLYGMSDNLRKHAKHYTLSNEDRAEFIHAVWDTDLEPQQRKINDFASVVFFEKKTREILMKSDMHTFKMYRQHYYDVARLLGI